MIKWSACCLAAVLMSGIAHATATPYPAANDESAWPGTGPIRVFPWMTDNRNFFSDIKDKSQDGIVFIGDSLFGNMGYSPDSKSAYFPNRKIVNRAIGGDVTRGVLWRLQEDALDLNPKALVILIGTNDLSAHAKPDGVVANIKAIIEKANTAKPDMPIILCTLPPRKSKEAPIDNQWLIDTNNGIRGLSSEKNVTILDLYPLFVGANDEPDPQYYRPDHLHFDKPGYTKIASELEKIFAKLNI